MFNLTIKAYQYDSGTVRFIYQVQGSLDLHVASCEDYTNMVQLMRAGKAIKLSNDVDIYDYRRELYKAELESSQPV